MAGLPSSEKVSHSGEENSPRSFQLLDPSRRGELQPQQPVVHRGGDRRRGDEFQIAGRHFGRQIGGQRRGRFHLQDARTGCQVGRQKGVWRGEFEPRERNPSVPISKTSLRPFDRESAAFGEGQLADLQGDLSAAVVERVDRQIDPVEDDPPGIEPLRRMMPRNP